MTILKQYRLNNELSQEYMAGKLGISLNAYRNYEIGKRTIPYLALIKFLKLRGLASDIKLAKSLEEICQDLVV